MAARHLPVTKISIHVFYSPEEHLIVSPITKTKWFGLLLGFVVCLFWGLGVFFLLVPLTPTPLPTLVKNPEYQLFHTLKPQEELLSKAKIRLSLEIFKWCFTVILDFPELSACQKNHVLPKI